MGNEIDFGGRMLGSQIKPQPPSIDQYAYIDESGDTGLETEKIGTSRYYVVAAVLSDGSNNSALEEQCNEIRRRHFQQGVMKSDAVAGSLKKRRAILGDLANAGLRYVALVVDKSKIRKDTGLRFLPSFYKFLNGRLCGRLYRAFATLRIFVDTRNTSDFMRSFKNYVEQRYAQLIFDQADLQFVNDENFVLVQAADFIAGSLGRIYAGKDPRNLLQTMEKSALIIEYWPPAGSAPEIPSDMDEADAFDKLIAWQGQHLASLFLNAVPDDDDEDFPIQAEAIRYLLYQRELHPDEYVFTDKLLIHLNSFLDEPLLTQGFRSRVIGKLRTKGVMIASSNKGYKIPCSMSEMDAFVSLVDKNTIPYLRRLLQARKHLKLTSHGRCEIVPESRYPDLSACLKALDGVLSIDRHQMEAGNETSLAQEEFI